MQSGGSCFSEPSKVISFVPHSPAEYACLAMANEFLEWGSEVELRIARPSSLSPLGLYHVIQKFFSFHQGYTPICEALLEVIVDVLI
jgi:hypothetical protein